MAARLRLRVQPGAREPGWAGRAADGVLKLKVRELAQEGRANEAVCAWLAARLGVRQSEVRMVRGAASRLKSIEIEGLTQEQLEERIAAALAAEPTKQKPKG